MNTEEINKTGAKNPDSWMAFTSMGMGFASIACFGFGILAIIFSLISVNKIKKGLQCGKKLAIAGLVTGIAGTVFIIILTTGFRLR